MKIPRPELKQARIEIIPLIDTIFFLLVYFMVASLSMVQMSAFRVALPQSSTAQGKPREKVVISLSNTGRYFIDQTPTAYNAIPAVLRRRVSENPYLTIVINVDKSQTVKQFLGVMNMGEAADPADLVIATEPAH